MEGPLNWYKYIKIAQIWNTGPYEEFPNHFEENLQSLYELEYKWSMINQRPFNGLEQRRQNISDNLRNNLNRIAYAVKDVLSNVFSKWLGSHAILDPGTWARARVEDMEDEPIDTILYSMLNEYARYSTIEFSLGNYGKAQNESFKKILNFAYKNIDKIPNFKAALEEGLTGYREMLYSDLKDEGLEEFSERYNKEFKTEEEAESHIENISIEDIDVESLYQFYNAEDFLSFLSEAFYPDEILIELYEHCVFPLWYEHWKEQGIDETRDTIEKINDRLETANAENTQEFMAAVNLALNAAHQTGAMTDYIEQDTGAVNIEGVLEMMSKGTFVPEWNEELKQVGVQI